MESRWIWPFELLDKLGEGGMGVVYRARYVGNDRQVAVKLIPDEISMDATLLARFERELEVLKQLNHPNIVRCFGGRCESKQRYYAMELIPGGTLADHLAQRGPLVWERAVDFAIQMCSALQHAHEHGVIHRDIKPGNFLLGKNDQLKLSDFGLASVVAEGRLTAAGRTVGTILYMAPEQIRGGSLTHRADLYALGCVIFEMLSGHTPFSGASAAEVLQRHLKDPPPHVMRHALDCPLELDSLICDLLSKNPEQRPASAAEVSSRLNAILLPSRRGSAAEPDLFETFSTKAAAKTVAITPLKKIVRRDSETDIPLLKPKRQLAAFIPWIVAVSALFLCTQLWFGWSKAVAQVRGAEEIWANLLAAPEPGTRVLAAGALAKFDHLSPSAIARLREAATSPVLEVRLAALKTLTQHAAESRSISADLLRIQKVDEHAEVRANAGLAVDAIQRTSSHFLMGGYVFWLILIAVLSGISMAGWRVWKSADLVVNSARLR